MVHRYCRGVEDGVDDPPEVGAAPRAEVIIGIVRALGVSTKPVTDPIYEFAGRVGYQVIAIHVSDLMAKMPGVEFTEARESDFAAYLEQRMDYGDRLRERYTPDILGLLSAEEIGHQRTTVGQAPRGVIYVLDSLLHPEEVRFLRGAYGPAFFLVGVFDHQGSRRDSLLQDVRRNHYQQAGETERIVDNLLKRNEGSGVARHALSIARTFHLADLFVSVADPPEVRRPAQYVGLSLTEITMRRFLEALFSSRNAVPNGYETGMAFAYVAARRSASLARQVGAAILSASGDLIATGYNDVPAPGGGQYPIPGPGDDDMLDQREFQFDLDELGRGVDTNDRVKWELVSDLLEKLRSLGGSDGLDRTDEDLIWELSKEAVNPAILDVISYTRCIHAEMSALMTAARRGVSVSGATLYCTTFPCHECARHVVAAGIVRVIYIEPYPKSRVAELFPDSIAVNAVDASGLVSFVPFVGMSPSRHADLFSYLPRKTSSVAPSDWGRAIEPASLPEEWYREATLRFLRDPFASSATLSAARTAEAFAGGILERLRNEEAFVRAKVDTAVQGFDREEE